MQNHPHFQPPTGTVPAGVPINMFGRSGYPVRNDNLTNLAYVGRGDGSTPPEQYIASAAAPSLRTPGINAPNSNALIQPGDTLILRNLQTQLFCRLVPVPDGYPLSLPAGRRTRASAPPPRGISFKRITINALSATCATFGVVCDQQTTATGSALTYNGYGLSYQGVPLVQTPGTATLILSNATECRVQGGEQLRFSLAPPSPPPPPLTPKGAYSCGRFLCPEVHPVIFATQPPSHCAACTTDMPMHPIDMLMPSYGAARSIARLQDPRCSPTCRTTSAAPGPAESRAWPLQWSVPTPTAAAPLRQSSSLHCGPTYHPIPYSQARRCTGSRLRLASSAGWCSKQARAEWCVMRTTLPRRPRWTTLARVGAIQLQLSLPLLLLAYTAWRPASGAWPDAMQQHSSFAADKLRYALPTFLPRRPELPGLAAGQPWLRRTAVLW